MFARLRSKRRENAARLAELVAEDDAISRSLAVIEFAMDGKILWANENFLQLMGYRLSELVGEHHRIFVDPADHASQDYRAFWGGLNEGRFNVAEYRRRAKDGRTVWIQGSYNPVFDAAGKPVKVMTLATDTTAAKHKSADDEGKITAIDRSQAVIQFGMDGTILDANANFLTLMGYDSADIVGRHHSIFVDGPSRRKPEYQAFWQRLRNGEYFSAEFKRITKDGREVWLQASYNPDLRRARPAAEGREIRLRHHRRERHGRWTMPARLRQSANRRR